MCHGKISCKSEALAPWGRWELHIKVQCSQNRWERRPQGLFALTSLVAPYSTRAVDNPKSATWQAIATGSILTQNAP